MTTHKIFGMINKKLLIGVFIGIIAGILFSFMIFLNVTSYRFGHVVNYFSSLLPSSNQTNALVNSSNENEVIFPNELTTWLADNLASTDIGYSASAEAFSRSNSNDAETFLYTSNTIDEQIIDQRDSSIITQNLDVPQRFAPLNIDLQATIQQSFNDAQYEIEVFSWEAYPGFFIPATIYKPLNANQEQLPAILIPTGCSVHLAWDDEGTSVERRAANFALSGFIVFNIPTGLCRQGIVGEQFENATSYEEFTLAGGSGLTSNHLGIIMLMRAIDLLENRADVDDSRIGVTGYSYGGGMASFITAYDSRIDAVAIVATSLFNNSLSQEIDTNVRHSTRILPFPDSFETGGHNGVDIHIEELPSMREMWNINLFYPRPVYFVMGDNDPGTPITSVNVGFARLSELYAINPELIQPRLDIVEGVHHYNASRRRLVIDWFIEVLNAEPILALAEDADEYATELLGRDTLENEPPNFGEITLHDIFVDSARNSVEQQQITLPFTERENPRQFLQDLLLLNDDEWQSKRSIILEERVFQLDDSPVSATFAILQLQTSFQSRALILAPANASTEKVHIYLTTQLYPLASDLIPAEVMNTLNAGETVIIVYPLGFAPLYAYQYRTYLLSSVLEQRTGTTLLGLGVQSLFQGVSLAHTLTNDTTEIILHADGVDAQNISLFATAIYGNVDSIIIENGVNSFTDFYDAPTNPIPPPTLAINGIMAYIDIQDLIDLSAIDVSIESTGELYEFRPYHDLIRY